nr:hypothetical protein [Tanacetum cinerariifolium]
STPVQDGEDDSPVEEVSPVKPKKTSRRAAMAKKDEPKEPPKDWTMAEETVLCQACKWKNKVRPRIDDFYAIINNVEENHENGAKKSKTSETTSGSAFGGLNLNEKADEAAEETQEF